MEEMDIDIDKLFEEVSLISANSDAKNTSSKNATTITSKGVAAATTSKDAADVTTKDAAITVSSDTGGIAFLNVASTSRDAMSAVTAAVPLNSCTSSNIAPCNIYIVYTVIYLIILI